MAHEIETLENGISSFASARQHAWHRLGQILPDTFNAADAMRYAQLGGWNVRKLPLQAVEMTPNGVTTLQVADEYASARTNPATGRTEVLKVVGADYHPIQNEEHAEILNALVGESGAHFETAGSLKGGRQVFLTLKLPQTMNIGGIDPIDLYIVACNSHDGSSRFRLMTTPVRVVCANTQAAAIKSARSTYSVSHTRGAHGYIAQAREALGLTFKFAEKFQEQAERMIDSAYSEYEFRQLIGQLWTADPTSKRAMTNDGNRRYELVSLLTGSETISPQIRGTRWGAYQAITEYIDHTSPTPAGKNAAIVRATRVASGPVNDIKTKAFELLTV